MGEKGKFKRHLHVSDYFPLTCPMGFRSSGFFKNKFFTLFCPPPEGAHKQLNERAVEIRTEKECHFNSQHGLLAPVQSTRL